jgi:hypothetical protein
MANASDLPEDIREALENVLRLKPDQDKARQMLDRLNERYPPEPKARADDFSFDDDPFADDFGEYEPHVYQKSKNTPSTGSRQPVAVTKPKSGGTNPLIIVLAILGVLTIGGCVVCVATGALGTIAAGQVFQQVLSDPTVQAAMSDPTVQAAFEQIGQAVDMQTLGDNVNQRGSILRGTTQRATVDTFTDDGWVLEGEQGQSITIECVSPDGTLDPELYLYNADAQLIAENDDIDFGVNTNSRIQINLPYTGLYTIVVSAFGEGGAYELTVR